jgi:putative hydrolase of the HAD superfamily
VSVLPRALFLDLDETLLDLSTDAQAVVATCQRISDEVGIEAAHLLKANTMTWGDYWPTIERDWVLGRLSASVILDEVWRRTLHACGCADEEAIQLAARTHGEMELSLYRLFDDAKELLDAIQDAELPLAIVTNGAGDFQRAKLAALDIEDHFNAIVVSGEVGTAKPDPSIFRIALEALDLEPEGVWHVGDNLSTDVHGARAAGLTAVWINRTGRLRLAGDPEPHLEISSLIQLLAPLALH